MLLCRFTLLCWHCVQCRAASNLRQKKELRSSFCSRLLYCAWLLKGPVTQCEGIKIVSCVAVRRFQYLIVYARFCCLTLSVLLEGCGGCSDRDSASDFRRQLLLGWTGALVLIWHSALANGSETFSQPHTANRFCWRAKQWGADTFLTNQF